MRKWIKYTLISLFVVALSLVGATWWLYEATQQVPQFYQQALTAPVEVQRQASDALLAEASDLVSSARKQGEWDAVFAEQEINGWLAIDLKENHPTLLPKEIQEPRLTIHEDEICLAWRVNHPQYSGVMSVSLTPEILEPNIMLLRIRQAKAGAVPLPLGKIMEVVNKHASAAKLPVRWTQVDGDPAALVEMTADDSSKFIRQITEITLGNGELYVSGTTIPRTSNPPESIARHPRAPQGQ